MTPKTSSKSFFGIYLQISLMLLVALGIAIGLGREVNRINTENIEISNRWARLRAQESLKFLNLNQDKLDHFIPVLGDSGIECTFEPNNTNLLLQEANISSLTLNLGIRDFTVKQTEVYAENLLLISKRAHRKFPLIILNIAPEMLTLAIENSYKSAVDEEQILSFSTPRALWHIQNMSLSERLNLLMKKYTLGDYSPTLNAMVLGRQMRILSQILFTNSAPPEPPSQTIEYFSELWSSSRFNQPPYWDPTRLGGFKFNQPASAEEYQKISELLSSPAGVAEFQSRTKSLFDLEGLKLSPRLLNDLSLLIARLKTVSGQVVLTNIPMSPRTQHGPSAIINMKSALKRIASDQDVPLYFLDDQASLSSQDYLDPLHLTNQGALILDKFYAEIVKRHLK